MDVGFGAEGFGGFEDGGSKSINYEGGWEWECPSLSIKLFHVGLPA